MDGTACLLTWTGPCAAVGDGMGRTAYRPTRMGPRAAEGDGMNGTMYRPTWMVPCERGGMNGYRVLANLDRTSHRRGGWDRLSAAQAAIAVPNGKYSPSATH